MASSYKKKKMRKEAREKIKEKKNINNIIGVILILVLLAISFYYILYFTKEKEEEKFIPVAREFVSLSNTTLVSMKVPAVDSEGKGVSTLLVVETMSGSGRTLVDIENLLFWADTQHSMRIARLVAAILTGINISEYDLIYNIYANASLIGGESAGAALTIATIAALENKTLNTSVMITGSINHDGSIGPVSAILEKAKASRQVNATLFLVPLLQSRDVIYETKKHCEKFGWTEICTIEQIPKKINVEEQASIRIEEVSSVKEAMDYFFSD